MNRDKREIGTARDILDYIFHIEGSPIEQAEAIKELIDRGYKQKDIARMLGWSTARVSQRLAYLKLIPPLRERARRGEISKYTAWHLAHLPEEKQREFIDKEKIRLRDAEEARRETVISSEVMEIINAPLIEDLESKPIKIKCGKCQRTLGEYRGEEFWIDGMWQIKDTRIICRNCRGGRSDV